VTLEELKHARAAALEAYREAGERANVAHTRKLCRMNATASPRYGAVDRADLEEQAVALAREESAAAHERLLLHEQLAELGQEIRRLEAWAQLPGRLGTQVEQEPKP